MRYPLRSIRSRCASTQPYNLCVLIATRKGLKTDESCFAHTVGDRVRMLGGKRKLSRAGQSFEKAIRPEKPGGILYMRKANNVRRQGMRTRRRTRECMKEKVKPQSDARRR